MLKSLDTSTVGYRIRLARTGLNLTQKQLADAVHVGSSYLAAVERGRKNASEDLIKRIAAVTHTTTEWILGRSDNQTAYPEPNSTLPQIKGNTAGIGYLANLIKQSIDEHKFPFHTPKDPSLFPKTDWLPDFWLYSDDDTVPINYWAFDLSLCIYKQPDIWGDGTASPRFCYFNFLSNLVFANPAIRKTTKYTFVIADPEVFDAFCKKPMINLGNISIMLISLEKDNPRVVREFTLCTTENCRDYLENTLHF